MIKFKDENKMKKYLSQRAETEISQIQFNDCKEYMISILDFIKEEREDKCLIREKACIELEVDNEEYEVWVSYDSIIENGEKITLIDFDYEYEDLLTEEL